MALVGDGRNDYDVAVMIKTPRELGESSSRLVSSSKKA